jgi:hypothetical protein
MGIIVRQDEEHNSLHDRISAELREKSLRTTELEDVDLEADSAYIKGLKQTGRFSWIWAVAILVAIAILIAVLVI